MSRRVTLAVLAVVIAASAAAPAGLTRASDAPATATSGTTDSSWSAVTARSLGR
jgi:hypothetical protein